MKVLPVKIAEPMVEASTQTSDRPRRNKDQAQQEKDSGSTGQDPGKSQVKRSHEEVSGSETSQPTERQIVDSQKLVKLLNQNKTPISPQKQILLKKLSVKIVTNTKAEVSKKI